MLTLGEMLYRFGAAIVLGLLVGLEREAIGKEAGVRTDMLVAAGAAIFSIVGLSLPYIIAVGNLPDVIARNSGFLAVIANIVVGIGFLGGGIIVKQGVHVRSVTTAAAVWFVAAVGVLCGIGLIEFAGIVTVSVIALLLIFRRLNIPVLIEKIEQKEKGNS